MKQGEVLATRIYEATQQRHHTRLQVMGDSRLSAVHADPLAALGHFGHPVPLRDLLCKVLGTPNRIVMDNEDVRLNWL